MYVGYFGAAAGVMLLVVLGMMIDESLVRLNAVKTAVSGGDAMAAVCFTLFGDVRWALVVPLAAGFLRVAGSALHRQEGSGRPIPGRGEPMRLGPA